MPALVRKFHIIPQPGRVNGFNCASISGVWSASGSAESAEAVQRVSQPATRVFAGLVAPFGIAVLRVSLFVQNEREIYLPESSRIWHFWKSKT
jgi:hypothetical protein